MVQLNVAGAEVRANASSARVKEGDSLMTMVGLSREVGTSTNSLAAAVAGQLTAGVAEGLAGSCSRRRNILPGLLLLQSSRNSRGKRNMLTSRVELAPNPSVKGSRPCGSRRLPHSRWAPQV